jgi:hypothetical protein
LPAQRDGRRGEPLVHRPRRPHCALQRLVPLLLRHVRRLQQVRRPFGRGGAEPEAAGVDPLHVDGAGRRRQRARDLDRHGDAAPCDPDDDRRRRQRRVRERFCKHTPGRRAVAEQRLHPRHDAHCRQSFPKCSVVWYRIRKP